MSWHVPGYVHRRELGNGATGRVVLAVHEETGDLVVIKYLKVNDETIEQVREDVLSIATLDSAYFVRIREYVEEADGRPSLLVGDPLAEHLHVVASLHHRDRSRWSTGLADQLAERLVEGRVGVACPAGLGVLAGGRTERRRCCKNQCSYGGPFLAEKERNEGTYQSSTKMVQEDVDF